MLAVANCVALGLPSDVSAQVLMPEVDIRPFELPKEAETKNSFVSPKASKLRELLFDNGRRRLVSNTSDDQVLIGKPIAGCPLVFLKFSIHSYKLIYRQRYAAVLADDSSPLHQDVCECRLMPEDYRACALKTIVSKAKPISTTPPPDRLLQGIQISITDALEFEKLC